MKECLHHDEVSSQVSSYSCREIAIGCEAINELNLQIQKSEATLNFLYCKSVSAMWSMLINTVQMGLRVQVRSLKSCSFFVRNK